VALLVPQCEQTFELLNRPDSVAQLPVPVGPPRTTRGGVVGATEYTGERSERGSRFSRRKSGDEGAAEGNSRATALRWDGGASGESALLSFIFRGMRFWSARPDLRRVWTVLPPSRLALLVPSRILDHSGRAIRLLTR
jgi:hypothetical protein